MKFIVYAPSYNDASGGTIALHKLCDELNRANVDCKIIPLDFYKIHTDPKEIVKALAVKIKQKIFGIPFKCNDLFNTPLAKSFDRENTVVIYPEIVKNNPLNAKHVVRWLLFKNEWFSENHEKYCGEIFFYFQEAFRPTSEKIYCAGELQIIHIQTEIYFDRDIKEKKGSCHAIRKGKISGKRIPPDSILIDNLSHQEISSVFNKTLQFISYDPYTLYSQYAAICGCLSIVEPFENLTKEQWQPVEELRYGIAYGHNDIKWALTTKDRVLPYLKNKEESNNHSVNFFVNKCKEFFRF